MNTEILPTNESGHPEPYVGDYRVRDQLLLTDALQPDLSYMKIVGIDRDGDMPVMVHTSYADVNMWLPPQDQRALRDYLNQHVQD